MDVFEVARLITDRTVARHQDEISLIAYYGSRATGTATEESDLDFFYIPVEGTSPDAARSFVLEGVTFDFWPIPWETAELISMGGFRSFSVATGILANATPLWSRSEADVARLDALKARLARLQSGESRSEMRWRGLTSYPKTMFHLENLRRAVGEGSVAEARVSAWLLATAVLDCLALANQVTFDGGWAGAVEQVDRLSKRPEGLKGMLTRLVTSADPRDALRAADDLVPAARQVLVDLTPRDAPDAATALRDGYAELHEHLVKLRRACRDGDSLRASLEAFVLHQELAGLPDADDLPDLPAEFDPEDLAPLAAAGDRFQARLVERFDALGLDRHVFESVADLERWLSTDR